MRINRLTSSLAPVLVAAGMLASISHAQVIINDQFNDGNLGINSDTGTGFANIGQAAASESGGYALLNSSGSNSSTYVIRSNNSFNPFDATKPTVLTVNFGSVANGSNNRQVIGYRLTSDNGNHFLPGSRGLYVGYNYTSDGEPTRGYLRVTNSSNVTTTLATWNWTNAANLSGMTLVLTTTATTYSLAFSGASGASSVFVTGASSGTLPSLGAGSAYSVLAHSQRLDGNVGTTLTQIDSLVVSQIPEPGTFGVFAAFGALGCAVMRRRRVAR